MIGRQRQAPLPPLNHGQRQGLKDGTARQRLARFALAPLFCLLLAACQTPAIHSCPPVPAWTPEDSAELADEIEALPPEADKIERALGEAYIMRRQAEECR